MRNNKGITMISLVITIIVLLIVTSITVHNGLVQMKIKRVNNLYADIDSLSTKVAEYYLKNKTIPIYNEPYVEDKNELKVLFNNNGATETEKLINVNDEGAYYVLDLSKLDNLTLNYGDDYKTWNSSEPKSQNVYIINAVTHQIYFPHGIKLNDEYYFARFPDENEITAVELGEIDSDLEVKIISISGNNLEDDKISLVADVELKADETQGRSLKNFNLNTLEYTWSNTNDESYYTTLSYTKFSIDSINEHLAHVKLLKNSLERNQEYIYLVIRAMDINGEKQYFISEQINVPIVLPDEYQKVEYIKSTGTQYINTGVRPANTLKTNIIYTDNAASGSNYVLGSRTGAQGSSSIHYGIVGNASDYSIRTYFLSNDGNDGTIIGPKRSANIKYDVLLEIQKNSDNKYIIHSTLKDLTNNNEYNTDTSPNVDGITQDYPNIYVFAIKDNQIHKGMSLHQLTFWNENILIRNFIPCYRKSDNKPGMYDIVNNQFYTNAGTGEFIAGDNIY